MRAWPALAAALTLSACVSAIEPLPADATLLLVNEGGRGVTYFVSPYDEATNTVAARTLPNGRSGTQVTVRGGRTTGPRIVSRRVRSGEFVIAVTERPLAKICPPIRFTLAPGQIGYLGRLQFEGRSLVALSADGLDAVREQYPTAVPLPARRAYFEPRGGAYPGYANVLLSPCDP